VCHFESDYDGDGDGDGGVGVGVVVDVKSQNFLQNTLQG
jgi:hypothetical protein